MSICVTESLESRRMLDAVDRQSTSLEQAEADLAYEFIKAMEAGDPAATPDWTGTTPDYAAAREAGIPYADKRLPRRPVTVGEALGESLDYGEGPTTGDVLKVLSLAMKGTDPTVALAARQLVERCANVYARHNAEEA